jgi:hypothetical protein
MSTRKYAMSAAMMAAMLRGMMGGMSDNTLHNGVNRKSNPWDNINIPKAQRKGKSPEEIKAMRMAIYEASIA